ncbi:MULTISPECIES: hypothetical protein [unclassified Brevibacterium]|uniref:hypothetical protein n=1 Tax=unclassified Brevibacterium TaxID=2614124 RepID=UPI001E4BC665|nr:MULTISPECIES: hypothetical protein [unclassified Brevibacterium]MDK8435974.1 hypothetical protein [Brevibacterium sp. H-BE7]
MSQAQQNVHEPEPDGGTSEAGDVDLGAASAGRDDADLGTTSVDGDEAGAASVGETVSSRSQVLAHDGEPVSDDMASAAAVAAVVAIRQVARAYAANQAAALDQMETNKHGRAGFNAPRRNVRRKLPQTWDQPLGR